MVNKPNKIKKSHMLWIVLLIFFVALFIGFELGYNHLLNFIRNEGGIEKICYLLMD